VLAYLFIYKRFIVFIKTFTDGFNFFSNTYYIHAHSVTVQGRC